MSSTLKRSATGVMLGAAVSASYAGIGASPQERVGVPVAIGLLVALALDEERDVGLGIVVGSIATSALISKAQGRPALEYLPDSLRAKIEMAPRRIRGK